MTKFFITLSSMCLSLSLTSFAGECGIEPKLDSELCQKFAAAQANDIFKVDIIFRRPNTVSSDPNKQDSLSSKMYLDSINSILTEKRHEILSIVAEYALYVADDYPAAMTRMTEATTEIDFMVTAAATKETILSMANQKDLIVRFETHVDKIPLSIRSGNSEAVHGWRSISFSVNGNRIETVIPEAYSGDARFMLHDVSGKLIRDSRLTSRGSGDFNQLHVPHGYYFVTIRTNHGQFSRKLLVNDDVSIEQ